MPPRSNVPIRIGGSKSRAGCKTCKQRHVKCDERRPICVRCQKLGRQCIYEQPPPPLALQEASAQDKDVGFLKQGTSQHRTSPNSLRLLEEISAFGTRESTEVTAVHHFVLHMGKELGGCFSDKVWRQILPQVAQHEPAIWHGVVAAATLDTSLRRATISCDQSLDAQPAVRQYTKALHELNLRLASARDTRAKNVILLCCILLAVFECLRDNLQSALQHISGGMKLLMEWTSELQSGHEEAARGYLDYKVLQPIFFSLDSQAVQMGVINFRHYFDLPAIKSQTQIPKAFSDVEEAHVFLNQIFYRLSRWAHWVGPEMPPANGPSEKWMSAEQKALQTQLTEWDVAFGLLPKPSDIQAPSLLLMIQRKSLQAFSDKIARGSSEVAWDPSLPLFQELVELAETYMEMTAPSDEPHSIGAPTESKVRLGCSNKPRSMFTVTMDIVMPLWLICAKCRDADVRRRALKLLKMCGRKEGIWDSYLSAVVVENMIELEEGHALADGYVPGNARVYETGVRLYEGRKADFVYKMLVDDGNGNSHTEIATSSLTW